MKKVIGTIDIQVQWPSPSRPNAFLPFGIPLDCEKYGMQANIELINGVRAPRLNANFSFMKIQRVHSAQTNKSIRILFSLAGDIIFDC